MEDNKKPHVIIVGLGKDKCLAELKMLAHLKSKGIDFIVVDDTYPPGDVVIGPDFKGTIITDETLKEAFEKILVMHPPKPMGTIRMIDIEKPPMFDELPRSIFFNNSSPIDAIKTHRKKGKYRP